MKRKVFGIFEIDSMYEDNFKRARRSAAAAFILFLIAGFKTSTAAPYLWLLIFGAWTWFVWWDAERSQRFVAAFTPEERSNTYSFNDPFEDNWKRLGWSGLAALSILVVFSFAKEGFGATLTLVGLAWGGFVWFDADRTRKIFAAAPVVKRSEPQSDGQPGRLLSWSYEAPDISISADFETGLLSVFGPRVKAYKTTQKQRDADSMGRQLPFTATTMPVRGAEFWKGAETTSSSTPIIETSFRNEYHNVNGAHVWVNVQTNTTTGYHFSSGLSGRYTIGISSTDGEWVAQFNERKAWDPADKPVTVKMAPPNRPDDVRTNTYLYKVSAARAGLLQAIWNDFKAAAAEGMKPLEDAQIAAAWKQRSQQQAQAPEAAR